LLSFELPIRTGGFIRFLVVDRSGVPSRAEGIKRLIDGNPVDPAVKPVTGVVARQVLESLKERRLGHIHRILPVVQRAPRDVENWLLIALEQLLEGISMPLQAAPD
jgi:hypothetical protein